MLRVDGCRCVRHPTCRCIFIFPACFCSWTLPIPVPDTHYPSILLLPVLPILDSPSSPPDFPFCPASQLQDHIASRIIPWCLDPRKLIIILTIVSILIASHNLAFHIVPSDRVAAADPRNCCIAPSIHLKLHKLRDRTVCLSRKNLHLVTHDCVPSCQLTFTRNSTPADSSFFRPSYVTARRQRRPRLHHD